MPLSAKQDTTCAHISLTRRADNFEVLSESRRFFCCWRICKYPAAEAPAPLPGAALFYMLSGRAPARLRTCLKPGKSADLSAWCAHKAHPKALARACLARQCRTGAFAISRPSRREGSGYILARSSLESFWSVLRHTSLRFLAYFGRRVAGTTIPVTP